MRKRRKRPYWVTRKLKECAGRLVLCECATLEHQITEDLNDILKQVFEDITNLERDFRKI